MTERRVVTDMVVDQELLEHLADCPGCEECTPWGTKILETKVQEIVFPIDLRSAETGSGTPVAVFPILNFYHAEDETEYVRNL